jgi:hypothetical protein
MFSVLKVEGNSGILRKRQTKPEMVRSKILIPWGKFACFLVITGENRERQVRQVRRGLRHQPAISELYACDRAKGNAHGYHLGITGIKPMARDYPSSRSFGAIRC